MPHAAPLLLACALAALAGCSRGPRNFVNDNDRLRRENLALEQQVKDLQAQVEALQGQAHTLQQQLDRSAAHVPGVKASQIPRPATVRLGRHSGFIAGAAGEPDTLRVYVQPRDQHDRFIGVVGPAVLQAVAIRDDGPPTSLARTSLSPAQFHAAYRSSLTGTHYTIDLKVPQADSAPRQVTARFSLTDAATGATISAQQVFRQD